MNNIKPMIFNLAELKHKAESGDGLAAYLLGRSYFSEENGAKQDYKSAVAWYKYGAETLNDARCIYGLGICYDDGVGVSKDQEKSDKLFKAAYKPLTLLAKQNDPFSMFILGAYYFYGFAGIKQDNKEAFETICEAAQMGHIAGIYDMGTFYYNGTGVDIDYSKSKEYLELAASAGLKRAKQKLIEWENDFNNNEKVNK